MPTVLWFALFFTGCNGLTLCVKVLSGMAKSRGGKRGGKLPKGRGIGRGGRGSAFTFGDANESQTSNPAVSHMVFPVCAVACFTMVLRF